MITLQLQLINPVDTHHVYHTGVVDCHDPCEDNTSENNWTLGLHIFHIPV